MASPQLHAPTRVPDPGSQRPPNASSPEGAMRNRCCAPLLLLLLLSPLLLTPPAGDAAVITGACDKDPQCGGGMCCAVSIWVKSIRICTPLGKLGDNCHPLSRKVPYLGRRMHHTCPCMPGLACSQASLKRFVCLPQK